MVNYRRYFSDFLLNTMAACMLGCGVPFYDVVVCERAGLDWEVGVGSVLPEEN